MKKLAIILVLAVLPYVSNAQSYFDKYENMSDVTSMVITNKMFKLLSKIDFESSDKETQEYLNLVENINNIKVFITDNKEISQKMQGDVGNYLKSSSLDELMRVKSDDGENIKFYIKPGSTDDYVSELFMYLEGNDKKDGPESIILTITGKIDLRQVSKLADDLNIPGGKELKKVKKGN
ncbi:DUF4252 domain-containing protein [Aquimarina sp. AD10]|uniref:DUF4252 domain-containing protein n=1 Tax=Aquimarina sp. AD10 TaxID=1714849 RepID=UPI000E4C83B9|nr:DUF4252 domain-containing protein [Aquimarina sp. AD10]AXT59025.1 DUF4252 domain-containing protein [Aquimarina sp. AD10]RKM95120.1 DUF4252 domain-containing protein [Aquimarina sp. AD10]